MKDFLFFNYSWVRNSTILFDKFQSIKGHSIDVVDETNIRDFRPSCKYKNVVLYLHEGWTIPITNNIINDHCKDSVLIQHDTTDFEDVQVWSSRKPDMVMQRELTNQTKNVWNCPVEPFHFGIESIYDNEKYERDIDVSLMATMTNPRRAPFVRHVVELAKGSLSHLKWHLEVSPINTRTPEKYREVCNRSKIGLHYFGNSYDSIRIWELASCKAAIIMPKMRNLSVSKSEVPFEQYMHINDDFSDLEEKITFLLEEDRYVKQAEKCFEDYQNNHCPEKYFESYYAKIMKYARV